MRGKSPRYDVEMTKKTKFCGGHLGFLTGISLSMLTELGTHILNSLLNKFCSLRSIQMSIFLELFQKNSFFIIYINISNGLNSRKNCSIDQLSYFTILYPNVNIFGVIQEKLIFDHLYTYFKGP